MLKTTKPTRTSLICRRRSKIAICLQKIDFQHKCIVTETCLDFLNYTQAVDFRDVAFPKERLLFAMRMMLVAVAVDLSGS